MSAILKKISQKNGYTFRYEIEFFRNHNELFRYESGYFRYNPEKTVIINDQTQYFYFKIYYLNREYYLK